MEEPGEIFVGNQPITKPKEQPLLLLPGPSVDNQLKQQPRQDNCPYMPLNHSQKASQKSGDFQKQSLFPVSQQAQELKLQPSQQLSTNPQVTQTAQEMSESIQQSMKPEPLQPEQKQIIEILEEMDHDEETPVFGVPNPTQTLVQETESPSIIEKEQSLKPLQQQEHEQGEMILIAAPIPIVLEDSQPQVGQKSAQQEQQGQVSANQGQIVTEQLQQRPQQTHPQPSPAPISQEIFQNPQVFPSPSIKPQQTQIIIESQSEQEIIVPQKAPQPSPVQTMRLNAENIRKLLLEADSDWTDIIKNASQAEILQFYQELTNKIEINGNQHDEQQQQQQQGHGNQNIVVVEDTVNSQEKPTTQLHQQLQPIIEEPQTTYPSIPQQHSPTTLPISLSQPSQQQLPIPISPQQSDEFKQFQLITAALYQTYPQLQEHIQKLSNDELRALYRETMEENKKKEESGSKKKKKKNTHPVIDLEDEAPIEPIGSEQKLQCNNPIPPQTQSPKATTQHTNIHQQPLQTSSFSYLTQHQKRKSRPQKPIPIPTTPIYVNKTLLYSLIQSHDFQNKLKSILMPKQSIKYQEKTQKEMALLYMNHLRANNISKGPFEAINTKAQNLTVLCKKKQDVKGEAFKKVAKEGLTLRIDVNLSDEKKRRIQELRQQRIQGAPLNQMPFLHNQQPPIIPAITSLPSCIPILPATQMIQAASTFGQVPNPTKPCRRYCLIVQEQLCAREQEEIGLQSNKKRVKKSSNPEEEKELLGMLRRMIELQE